jgi:hypothetical protein
VGLWPRSDAGRRTGRRRRVSVPPLPVAHYEPPLDSLLNRTFALLTVVATNNATRLNASTALKLSAVRCRTPWSRPRTAGRQLRVQTLRGYQPAAVGEVPDEPVGQGDGQRVARVRCGHMPEGQTGAVVRMSRKRRTQRLSRRCNGANLLRPARWRPPPGLPRRAAVVRTQSRGCWPIASHRAAGPGGARQVVRDALRPPWNRTVASTHRRICNLRRH